MARVKEETHTRRLAAAKIVAELLEPSVPPKASQDLLHSISEVKGLFNRVRRQDQWDHFTVCSQLGYPEPQIAGTIADELANLRTAVKTSDQKEFCVARSMLRRMPTRQALAVFQGERQIATSPDHGWIYILSARDEKDLLKIGMTTRTVEERARELNSHTITSTPLGARRCWRVRDPKLVEKAVHKNLDEFRVRDDREFFRIEAGAAARIIEKTIIEHGLESRPLDALEPPKSNEHSPPADETDAHLEDEEIKAYTSELVRRFELHITPTTDRPGTVTFTADAMDRYGDTADAFSLMDAYDALSAMIQLSHMGLDLHLSPKQGAIRANSRTDQGRPQDVYRVPGTD